VSLQEDFHSWEQIVISKVRSEVEGSFGSTVIPFLVKYSCTKRDNELSWLHPHFRFPKKKALMTHSFKNTVKSLCRWTCWHHTFPELTCAIVSS
jgi:hypothetical protein